MTDASFASTMSPLHIFMTADRLVQAVILLLILASVVSWSLMIGRYCAILAERRRVRATGMALEGVSTERSLRHLVENGSGRVVAILSAIEEEWRSSNPRQLSAYEPVRDRILSMAEIAVAREIRKLAGRTTWLATIGATAPFVGLFGTVWGIMASFMAIGHSQDTSLAVVAPGIAEALLATAVGLFCAIPAVIGYNRLQQSLADIEGQWRSAAGQLEIALSRNFDRRLKP